MLTRTLRVASAIAGLLVFFSDDKGSVPHVGSVWSWHGQNHVPVGYRIVAPALLPHVGYSADLIPLHTNKIRSNVFSGAIFEHGATLSSPTYIIDAGGLGINVCQDLEDLGCVVNRVNWGNPCFRNINKVRYLNLRAQAMHHAARAAKEGRLSIRTLEHQRAMIDQSSRIPKTFNEKARIRVPPKHSAEWEGLKSPDLWDTVCFLFLETAEYIVADDHPRTGKGGAGEAQTDLTEIAAGLFAGVDAE